MSITDPVQINEKKSIIKLENMPETYFFINMLTVYTIIN